VSHLHLLHRRRHRPGRSEQPRTRCYPLALSTQNPTRRLGRRNRPPGAGSQQG